MAARLAGMDRQAQKVAQAAPSRAAKIAGNHTAEEIAEEIAAGRLPAFCGRKQKVRDSEPLLPQQKKTKRTSAVFESDENLTRRKPAAAAEAGAAWRQKWPAALLASADEMLRECEMGGLEDMSPAERDGYLGDTLREAREYDPAAFREPARRPSAAAPRSWRQAYPPALLEAADESCEECPGLGSLDAMAPAERQAFLQEMREMIESY